jgi:integrase
LATIRKRGTSYTAQVIRKIGDRRVCRTATFGTRAEASAWAVEVESELLRMRRTGVASVANNNGKVTLYRAIETYMEERAPNKRGERWETVRCQKFMRELPFVGKLVDAVTPSDISDWMRNSIKGTAKKPGIKEASARREMTLLSAIFEYARREKQWIASNPVSLVTRPQKSAPRVRLISESERAAIIDALGYEPDSLPSKRSHYVALAFLFAIETGARAGEIRKLKWEFVNYEQNVARVTGGTKNGDYWRDLPLTRDAAKILKLCETAQLKASGQETLNGECFPISSGYLDTIFRRARDKCGIKDLHFHDTRHQAATDMAKKLTPYQLARALGHRTLGQIMVYYNEDVKDIAGRLQ